MGLGDTLGGLDLSRDTVHGDVQLNPFQGNFNANPWANNSGQGGAAPVDPSLYQYGGNPGAAQQWENQFGQSANDEQAAQKANQAQLGQFYQGQLSGTGPSLAAQQAKASTDQSIAAQQATAASARGTLGQAGAQMQAAALGAQARQAGAQQAVQGRVAEEYAAAQGLQGLAGQEQQGALGWTGEQQGVAGGQIGANVAQGNYQLGQGSQAQQGSEYGSSQPVQLAGALIGAGGAALSADADLKEPGGGAAITMREEKSVDGRPFTLIIDRTTGDMEKMATVKLTPEERKRAEAPHGAGPLAATDPRRQHTTFSDMAMGNGLGAALPPPAAPMTLGPRGRGVPMAAPMAAPNPYAQQIRAAMPQAAPIVQPLPIANPQTGRLFAADVDMGAPEPKKRATKLSDLLREELNPYLRAG